MTEVAIDVLAEAAKGAVEAATGAGAGDSEAWAEGSREREVRVHGGEVESLTEASGRGVGVRAWIGERAGYAYGTYLT
jgi:PmbA protein